MLITLTILLLPSAPVEGAVMRTWELNEGLSTLQPLMPGQPPNDWTKLSGLVDVALPGRDVNVLSLIDGAIVVDRPGEWCFELMSDDGSQLWVTGTRVVNNDGLHGMDAETGCKTLDAGAHDFQVKWFQTSGGAGLSVLWKGPGDDAFSPIPATALRGIWPASRPTKAGDKIAAASSSRRRPGDGRPLDQPFPAWRSNRVDVSLDGLTTCMIATGPETVAVGTEAGSIWIVDVRHGTATQFGTDLPVPRAMEVSGERGIMVAHDDGVLLLRDNSGNGIANDERQVDTLVPPGPRRVVRDGALRNRQGTVIARIDSETGIDRVLAQRDDGEATTVLLASPNEVWQAQLEAPEGRERATMTRMSGQLVGAAAVLDARRFVLSDSEGLHLVREVPNDLITITNAVPMANGLEVHLSQAVERSVLSDPSHWVLTWIDAAGGYSPIEVETASPRMDGHGAFLEVDDLPVPGTVHVRLVGPWTVMGGTTPPWSPECWCAIHAPLPGRTGTIVPRVLRRDNMLSPRETLEGWTLLFDGKHPDTHWRRFRGEGLPASWVVEDGMLVYTGEGGGDIITREQYDDFDLELEWLTQHAGNSGIFFNVAEDAGAVWATGPEMQILDNSGHADGKNALTSAGANYALHAPPFDASLPPGRWNRARIRVEGDHVQQWLNGIKTADYHLQSDAWKAKVADSKFRAMPRYGTESSGHIALQDHGDRVAFRNLRIRALESSDE